MTIIKPLKKPSWGTQLLLLFRPRRIAVDFSVGKDKTVTVEYKELYGRFYILKVQGGK